MFSGFLVLRPRRAVQCRPVLWAERDANTKIPQKKDYIISKQNRLNAPGYIARAWAHYNVLEGPHSHEKCHRVSVNCTKPIPNQTPMHREYCHSCASQRHPDTMHNTLSLKNAPIYCNAQCRVLIEFNVVSKCCES